MDEGCAMAVRFTMLGFEGGPVCPEGGIANTNGLILQVLELLASFILICSPVY